MKHSAGFLALVEAARPRIKEINPEAALARIAGGVGTVLVDIREDREWDAGHIKGAIHLGKGIIERDIEHTVPDKDAEIVLYCGGGFRSVLSADSLRQMGYTNVASMSGGWRTWNALGYPVEKP